MNLGLRIMRRIDPAPDLETKLDGMGHLHEITDKGGKTWKYVNDDDLRESEINNEITGGWDHQGRMTFPGCTLGFALMDEDNSIHWFGRSADMADRVLRGAKVTITPVVDVDLDVEEVQEPDSLPDPEPRRSTKPVAVSV